nr:hypothetical protein [Sphingomonas daechungensis]
MDSGPEDFAKYGAVHPFEIDLDVAGRAMIADHFGRPSAQHFDTLELFRILKIGRSQLTENVVGFVSVEVERPPTILSR